QTCALPILRRVAVLVDPERREEDLVGEMRVQRTRDLADHVEVAVDEARNAVGVLDRTVPAPARDEQRAARQAEILLHVDQDEVDPRLVLGGWLDPEALPPRDGGIEDRQLIRRILPARRVR